METMNTSPEISKGMFEKKNAMQEVFDKVEVLAGAESNTQGKLEAAKKILTEVRGKDYRLEEAAAKLTEYYEFELEAEKINLEVDNRKGELDRILPGLRQKLAANDSYFSDIKYKV